MKINKTSHVLYESFFGGGGRGREMISLTLPKLSSLNFIESNQISQNENHTCISYTLYLFLSCY